MLLHRLLKVSVLVFYRRFLPRRPYHGYILALAISTGGFAIAAMVVRHPSLKRPRISIRLPRPYDIPMNMTCIHFHGSCLCHYTLF